MREPPAHRKASLQNILVRLEHEMDELSRTIDNLRNAINDHDAPVFIALKAAADRSKFSGETIRLWAARGRVIAKKVGGRWFVEQRSLDERVQQRTSLAV